MNDRPVASITVRVNFNQSVVLSWCQKRTGEVIEQWVDIQTSSCYLGGQRHWFIRPRCYKRIALLYAPIKYFACRKCGGLDYSTQKEGVGDRAYTKVGKIRVRLGWEGGILNGNGGRPKGMHQVTYLRLKNHHDALVQISWQALGSKLDLLRELLER